jgi:hypothetical protein
LNNNLENIVPQIRTGLDSIGVSIYDITVSESTLLNISNQIKSLKAKQKSIENMKEKYESITETYNKATSDFDSFKKDIGSCPLCGSIL